MSKRLSISVSEKTILRRAKDKLFAWGTGHPYTTKNYTLNVPAATPLGKDVTLNTQDVWACLWSDATIVVVQGYGTIMVLTESGSRAHQSSFYVYSPCSKKQKRLPLSKVCEKINQLQLGGMPSFGEEGEVTLSRISPVKLSTHLEGHYFTYKEDSCKLFAHPGKYNYKLGKQSCRSAVVVTGRLTYWFTYDKKGNYHTGGAYGTTTTEWVKHIVLAPKGYKHALARDCLGLVDIALSPLQTHGVCPELELCCYPVNEHYPL